MADQFAIVTHDTPLTNNATQDYTSGSITEAFSAAILIFSHSTTDDNNAAHGILGIGFIGVDGNNGTNTLQCVVTCSLENNVTSAQDCDTARDILTCVRSTDGSNSASLDVVAEYDSSISGGVRLKFTQADVSIKCTAVLFAGLSKAAVGNCSFSDAGAGHENVGISPFWSPDVVIFRSSDNDLAADDANGTMALGFATNRTPILQVASYVNFDDRANPTDSDGYLRSDCCSAAFLGDRGVSMDRFQVTSFDSTGFNAIAIDTGGVNTPQANYLALKFTDSTLQLFADNLSVSSSTGTQSFVTGFTPSIVIGQSTLMTSEDSIIDGSTASSAGLFAFTASAARAYTLHNRENLTLSAIGPVPSEAHTRHGDYAVLTLSHLGAVAQQATLSSFTGTGFDLSFSTATAGFLTLLAIGAGSVDRIVSDTESITETVGFAGTLGAISDTVTISEETNMFTTDVSVTQGLQGETFAAHSERGTSLQPGAEEGTVM